tara:strand:- start:8184 stop:8600 length:417 start_codon:yes stop_codon:yes gene_type:complete
LGRKKRRRKKSQVKVNAKQFADIPVGTKMLIPTPKDLNKLVMDIPIGSFLFTREIRKKLAKNNNAEMTCPLVTGICMRIISEAAFEEYQRHNKIDKISPFWRIVEPDSKLANKLTCGKDFIVQKQFEEGIEVYFSVIK